MNLQELFPNAEYNKRGFWEAQASRNISYTENGHDKIQGSEKNSFWFLHRHKCLSKLVADKKNQLILDIGGGNGLFTKYLQDKQNTCILLEPGKYAIEKAIENGVNYAIVGSLHETEIESSSFDSIILLDVLEHIEDDQKFLKEINRILKDDGELILTVPALPKLYSEFDKMVGHYRRYKLNELTERVKNSGFSVKYGSYFFSLLPFPIIISRLLLNKFKKQDKKVSSGHIDKRSILGSTLRILLWPELLLLNNRIRIPIGSSCLVSAVKSPKPAKNV